MHSGISAGSFSLFWARLIGQVLCLLKKTHTNIFAFLLAVIFWHLLH